MADDVLYLMIGNAPIKITGKGCANQRKTLVEEMGVAEEITAERYEIERHSRKEVSGCWECSVCKTVNSKTHAECLMCGKPTDEEENDG